MELQALPCYCATLRQAARAATALYEAVLADSGGSPDSVHSVAGDDQVSGSDDHPAGRDHRDRPDDSDADAGSYQEGGLGTPFFDHKHVYACGAI